MHPCRFKRYLTVLFIVGTACGTEVVLTNEENQLINEYVEQEQQKKQSGHLRLSTQPSN